MGEAGRPAPTTSSRVSSPATRSRGSRSRGFQGTADSGNLVGALDDYLGSGSYEAGLVRADRPAAGDPVRARSATTSTGSRATARVPLRTRCLRDDPDLRLVPDLRRPRARTSSTRSRKRSRSRRRPTARSSLHPIEIFEVKGPIQLVRAASTVPLLVSGDGHAWPELSVAGLLDGTGPIRYTATCRSTPSPRRSTPERRSPSPTPTDGASSGSAVATPRRRTRTPSVPGQGLPEREVRTLFDLPGTQSVAWFPDAKRIVASGFGRPLGRAQTSFRPALAFDGDETTTWRASTLEEDGAGQWVRVDLREPTEVSRGVGSLSAPTFPNQPRATHARISFSDGSSVPVDLSNDKAVGAFEPREDEVRTRRHRRGPARRSASCRRGCPRSASPGSTCASTSSCRLACSTAPSATRRSVRSSETAPLAYLFRAAAAGRGATGRADDGAPVPARSTPASFTLGGTLGSQTQLRGRRCRHRVPADRRRRRPRALPGPRRVRGRAADRPRGRVAHAHDHDRAKIVQAQPRRRRDRALAPRREPSSRARRHARAPKRR